MRFAGQAHGHAPSRRCARARSTAS